MIDKNKIKYLKVVGITFVLFVITIVALLFMNGSVGKDSESNSNESSSLSRKWETEFLTAYLTKERLGSNREQYKDFMTTEMFQEEIKLEDDPTNRLYTEYARDFKFSDAEIYIDEKNNTVLAIATYDNTVYSLQNDDSTKLDVKDNVMSLRLTYKNIDGKYLIDQKELMMIKPVTELQE
ncbi:TPA: hypothetical protein ACGO97_001584 [Streptococcus suis]